jgi:hypothetical protein
MTDAHFSFGTNSFDVGSCNLIANSVLSIDWLNRWLSDSNDNVSLAWDVGTYWLLNQTGGTVVDWQLNLIYDNNAATSIDWGNRQLLSATGVEVVSWNDAGLEIVGAGHGLSIAEGSNARMGIATLSTGTVTVNNSTITANTRVFLTINAPGGTVGSPYISARSAGTSFTISSTSIADTSSVAWLLIEPS